MIEITYDVKVDMTYVQLATVKIDHTKECGRAGFDVDEYGNLLGIEFFGTPGHLRRWIEEDPDNLMVLELRNIAEILK